jgi:hypothetical protein
MSRTTEVGVHGMNGCNKLRGGAVLLRDTKDQVMIYGVIGLDKVNKGNEQW